MKFRILVFLLAPRVFCWIAHACRLIIANLSYRHADILKYFKQSLSVMAECYCTMMWETFFDQDMTIESAHFRNSKDTDGSKGTCCHRKDFTLSHISTKFIVCCALQTVKCDVTRFNISSSVPCVTSSGSVLAIIFWYFISQKDSLLEAVLPQWKPMNVSF